MTLKIGDYVKIKEDCEIQTDAGKVGVIKGKDTTGTYYIVRIQGETAVTSHTAADMKKISKKEATAYKL